MGFQLTPDPDYFNTSGRPIVADYFFDATGLNLSAPNSNLFYFYEGDFAYPVQLPVPHIEMTLFTFDAAAATLTVYRTVGRRTMPVRASIDVTVTEAVNVVDWDAPAGVPVTYWAAQFDIDGTFIGVTTPTTTQLDFDKTYISNPLDPTSAVAVELARGSAAKVTRQQDVDLMWADGTGLASAVTGQRHGVTDTPIRFYTLTDEDTGKVNDLLGDPYDVASGPMVLCIRPAGHLKVPWPAPFYALVDLEQQPVNLHAGLQTTLWDGTGTEVEPPALSLIAAVLTYEDLDAAYDSYEAMDAAYGSYQERDRDYRLAGTADPATGLPGIPTNLGIYGAGIYGS